MNPATDISPEISFKTARSGGKGGQNVNKVETMVEGYFNISSSKLLDAGQKTLLLAKLRNRISGDGILQVRSQVHRSQLSNRAEVIKKMNTLIAGALKTEKPRVPTRATASSRIKRLESKKRSSLQKQSRQRIGRGDYDR